MFLNRGKLVEDAPAQTFFAAPGTGEARAFLAGDLLW
jgi:tungstate transport system ATP-binding protein